MRTSSVSVTNRTSIARSGCSAPSLAVILIIGVLYFFLVQERKDLPPVHVPAESGPLEIPPESLAPEHVVTT